MSAFDGEDGNDFMGDMYAEESLMSSLDIEPRIFTLANPANTTLLGFVLTESEDSFLVGHPSRLVVGADEVSKHIEPFIPVPFIRLMKYNICMVVPVFGDFQTYFIEYLRTEANAKYPELSEDVDYYLDRIDAETVATETAKSEVDFSESLEEAKADGKVVSINSLTKH
jgi:hypothetical protein